tara:strand:+ start:248 stop:439 length:192 start_codon:yes stop_codon:yes gene_type:complete
MLIEMADDMGASLEDVISSIAEDSVIDLKRLQDDLGIVIIPEKCSNSRFTQFAQINFQGFYKF